MNLQKQLFIRIAVIALLCISGSAGYVMYQTNKQAISEANLMASTVQKQLRSQLLTMFTRIDNSTSFPNTEHWPELNGLSGACIQFISLTQSRERNLCDTSFDNQTTWPIWFGSLYEELFNPSYEVKRGVAFNAMAYGAVVVKLNSSLEKARAWNNLQAVIDVLAVSILCLSLLVFFTINRLLKPAKLIITGLEQMRDGQLQTRLPSFDVIEWKRTSEAINQLATAQQIVIADNKQLALKLINVQEEQQRYIARELHDEFGQCLSGINALVSSLSHSAQTESPNLVPEIKNISQISHHMMQLLRDMLTRLRPTEVDDLGLKISLNNLIDSWNKRLKGQTLYSLHIQGNLKYLSEPLPTNLYRIVQECLTNIAKHANASQAEIILTLYPHHVELTISDDGIADTASFDNVTGVGLLGIRERVTALGGQLELNTLKPGLRIFIKVPLLATYL
jgi:two-component system sensor histidine kinase UhpB